MRLFLAGLLGTLVALGLSIGPATAQAPPGLLVYSAQHAALTQAWAAAFARETGIPVAIRRGTDVALANQIVQEGANSPADIFLTENSPAMMLVDNAKLFAPVNPDTLAQVPKAYRPANGHWTGIAARTTVFAYNTEKLTPDRLPASMLDLAAPSWKGRWGAAPAGADFQAIVGALLLLKGEEVTADWLDGLRKNAVRYRGNGEALRGVNAGEIDGAVIYHYYWFGDRNGTGENSKNVGLHYFRNHDPGAFVSISGGGVLASSKHPEAGAGISQMDHGSRRPGDPARWQVLRIHGRRRRSRPPAAGTARLAGGADRRSLGVRREEGGGADGCGRSPLTGRAGRSQKTCIPPVRAAHMQGV